MPDGTKARRGRAIAWHVACALVCVGARGAETPAAPADARTPTAPTAKSAPGASISAAKRDFEAIKAARDPIQRPQAALPSLAVPELQVGSGDQPRPWLSPKSGKSEADTKKSANWLVDAMTRDPKARSSRGQRGVESTRGRGAGAARDASGDLGDPHDPLLDAGVLGAEEQRTESREDELAADAAREADDRPEVVNPLSQYLSAWMTPRDYEILRPGLEQSLSERSGDTDLRPPEFLRGGIAGRTDLLGATSGATGARPEQSAVFSAPAPRENPYLEALRIPDGAEALRGADAAVFAPVSAPVPPPVLAPAAVAPTPASVAPAKGRIPDFARPGHDEKYFKQLKRF